MRRGLGQDTKEMYLDAVLGLTLASAFRRLTKEAETESVGSQRPGKHAYIALFYNISSALQIPGQLTNIHTAYLETDKQANTHMNTHTHTQRY